MPLEQQFLKLGLIVNHSTSVFLNLCEKKLIRFESLPLEGHQQTPSSTWRNLRNEIPPIEPKVTHTELMTKVQTFLSKLATENPNMRYWIDRGAHKEGELYPDGAVSKTPTKKSESRQFAESASGGKLPHNEIEWNRQLFLFEVANINEFKEFGEEIDEQQIRKSSIKKKVGQLASYLLRNLAASGATEGYGAVTCYSHWLFIKAVLTENEVSFIVHNRIEKLNPNDKDIKNQKALLMLVSFVQLILKANAGPVQLVRMKYAIINLNDVVEAFS